MSRTSARLRLGGDHVGRNYFYGGKIGQPVTN